MVIVGIVLCLASFNAASYSFERLVDFEFEHHHDEWVRNGQPRGGPITRDDPIPVGSDWAQIACAASWLVKRPVWLPPDSEAERQRGRMMRWAIMSAIGAVMWTTGVVVLYRLHLAE